MSDIEVGEYVRTERGTIRKILKLDMREFEEFGNIIYETNDEDFYKEEIVKHSSNIIDLIEVGDYVNGYKVTNLDISIYKSKLEEVKSIVTKEQFKEVEYKVNE